MAVELFTEPLEFEKYVAPGAAMVALLWIFPRVFVHGLDKSAYEGIEDVAILILISYFAGHVLEAVKVYMWPKRVTDELKHFESRIRDLMRSRKVTNYENPQLNSSVRTVLFSVVGPAERAELTFNLVRWQKMVVFACLFVVSAVIWFILFVFSVLERLQVIQIFYNPLRCPWFNPALGVKPQLIFEIIAIIVSLWIASTIYSNAVDRQRKNNNAQYELIMTNFEKIMKATGIQVLPPPHGH